MTKLCLLCGENQMHDDRSNVCDRCFNNAGRYIEQNIHNLLAIPYLLQCTRFLRLVCEDRLSIERETQNDPDVITHYELLLADASSALAKTEGNA